MYPGEQAERHQYLEVEVLLESEVPFSAQEHFESVLN
jgi:hypothetical protein